MRVKKKYKIRKPKSSKVTSKQLIKVCVGVIIPVAILGSVLSYNTVLQRKEQTANSEEREKLVYTAGSYTEFEPLDRDIWVPENMEIEESKSGSSYSLLAVNRASDTVEADAVDSAYGILSIPNPDNKHYDIVKNKDEIVKLCQSAAQDAIVGVIDGLNPSLSTESYTRKILDDKTVVETFGTIVVNRAAFQFTKLDGDDSDVTVQIAETGKTYNYYAIITVVDNKPTIIWGIWSIFTPTGVANIRQSVVDGLASLYDVSSKDISLESTIPSSTTESTLVYDDSLGYWMYDLTGEKVEGLPPYGDPNFEKKYEEIFGVPFNLSSQETTTSAQHQTSSPEEQSVEDSGIEFLN